MRATLMTLMTTLFIAVPSFGAEFIKAECTFMNAQIVDLTFKRANPYAKEVQVFFTNQKFEVGAADVAPLFKSKVDIEELDERIIPVIGERKTNLKFQYMGDGKYGKQIFDVIIEGKDDGGRDLQIQLNNCNISSRPGFR